MAGSAKDVRAGRAFVELLTKDTELIKGLNRAQAKLQAFGKMVDKIGDGMLNAGKKFLAIGTAAAAGLLAMTKIFVDTGSALLDMSNRTGMSVEKLSELKYAAEQTGASLEDVETAAKRMQKTIGDAAGGSQQAIDALRHIGLTLNDLKGLSPDEQFEMITQHIAAVQDPTLRAAAALQLFGRSGTKLLPMIQQSSELQKRFKELGLTIGTDQARAAHKLGDLWTDIRFMLNAVAITVGSALAPQLTKLINHIIPLISAGNHWLGQHQQLVTTALAAAAGLITFGSGLISVGLALKVVTMAASGLATAVGVVATTLQLVLTPMGLIAAALVTGAALWVTYSETGQKAVQAVKDDALAGFGAIKDALLAGDIAAAAGVLWALVKLEWVRGVNALSAVWEDFKADLVKVGYGAFIGVLAAWEIARNALTESWTKLANFFGDLWTSSVETFQNVWAAATDWVAKQILKIQFHGDQAGYDKAVQLLEQQSKLDVRTRTDAANQERADRDARAQAKLDAENKRFTDAMAQLGKKFNDTAAAAEANAAAKKRENDASGELARAQKAYADAIDAARRSLVSPNAGTDESGRGRFAGIKRMAEEKRRADAAAAANAGADEFSKFANHAATRGTFSIFEAAGQGGNSDIPKRQLKAQQDQLTEQRKTRELLGQYVAAANTWH